MKGVRSTSPIFLLIICLLSVIHNGILFVGAIGETIRLQLVHKYSPHLNVRLDLINKTQIEIIKELHRQDMIRQQMLYQNRVHHQIIPRRKYSETNSSLAMPLHSGFDMLSGLYLVEVKIGTPPRTFLLAADTASDLTWIRCSYNNGTSTNEDKQKMLMMKKKHHSGNHDESLHFLKKDRVFHADLSSTFKPLPCSDCMCTIGLAHMQSSRECPTPLSPCRYRYSYMGGDSVEGLFGYDTITVPLQNGSKTKLPNVTIGCTESIHKFKNGDGILGLAFGDYSFSETVVAYNVSHKFSYCLMDYTSSSSVSSYVTFGPNNQTVNGTMTHTELVMMGDNVHQKDFFGVKVAGISVGGKLLNIPSQVWDVKRGGGVLLDSGHTVTALALPAYQAVMDELKKALSNYKTFVEEDLPFEFCFNATGFDESSFPRLAFHFADGRQFEPQVRNYVITPDTSPTRDWFKCLGFVPSEDGLSIIGNQMQQNHLWEFDIQHGTVGFGPSSCI